MAEQMILAAAVAARLGRDRIQEEQGMLQRLQEHLLSFVQVAEETVTSIKVLNLNVLLLEEFQTQRQVQPIQVVAEEQQIHHHHHMDHLIKAEQVQVDLES